jgi:glycosyltransferase involved in cell wall biosynthesis
MTKSISIIGTVGLPAKYGGFETLTEHLTRYLHKDYDITVYCSSRNYVDKHNSYNGARLVYIPLNANGIQSIPYDIISMIKALRRSDILLILGVSGCIAIPIVRLLTKKKIVVNIDGLEWKREKWGKTAKWFLKLSEQYAVKHAHAVVSDNRVVKSHVRTEYSEDSILIAYGADHVKKTSLSNEMLNKYDFLRNKYAFTVCRIEPENNIHIILEALSKQLEIHAILVGNWNANKYGSDLRSKYAELPHIHLLDPIYDQNVLNQLRSNCFIYLHGHSAGGTNPSLVEAMYLELPIFAYKVNYNQETTEHQAKYFSDSNELFHLINNNTSAPALATLGQRMAEIAKRRYNWGKISQQYDELFHSLL